MAEFNVRWEIDDPLIMCECCGADILQSEAIWRECESEGRHVPLCSTCEDHDPNYIEED